jgi:hypothetical protein
LADEPVRLDLDAGENDEVESTSLTERQWAAFKDQQDQLIKAMIWLFAGLNGAMVLLVFAAWIGDFWRSPPLITENVVMALIGATVVQAGVSFITITRFFFGK